MTNNSILPPIISANPHLRAFIDAAETLLAQNDLTVLLVYAIDTAPASVLPYLAGQFQVLGAGGWQYADTEAKQRELIKRALELNRFKGTPWAIKEALKIAGFGAATITEGSGAGGAILYDGTFNYNGVLTYTPSNHVWPFFSIDLEVGSFPINSESEAIAISIIKEYQNARSVLTTLNLI